MSLNKTLSAVAVAAVLAVSASPVYAKGYNASVTQQEINQVNNSADPSFVGPVGRGGPSLVDLELQQIPGGQDYLSATK